MERKIFIGAAESSNEMIFEGAYRSFGCIALMNVGGHKLVVDVFVNKELL